ncbi:MAG TPA: rhomboid family intramembrane serine protease [Planctomycetota bacterium]|nr:rhomboid family intramembrane serine protease [Planctomycetota bacterium]
MIPLRDNIVTRRPPFMNWVLIGVTSVGFLLQLTSPDDPLVEKFGMIPVRVLDPGRPIVVTELQTHPFFGHVQVERELAESPIPAWLTLLTCIFLHGGWLHFLGNMWFLHIFGDNVEDRLGHLGYLVFYLAAGAAASAAHLLTNSESPIPTIGASGAIAGVMGAYFVLFPRALVLTLVPIFFFIQIIAIPAVFFLGIWFLLQFLQGTVAIRDIQAGGVAWWAHIGGFVVGAVLVLILRGMRAIDVSDAERRSFRRPTRDHRRNPWV